MQTGHGRDPDRGRATEMASVQSRQHATCVSVKRSEKWYVVVDGREEGAYDDIEDGWDAIGRKMQVFFSPDGKRLGYCAKKERQWFAVVDGKLGEPFANLGRPVYSPESSRPAYRAQGQG